MEEVTKYLSDYRRIEMLHQQLLSGICVRHGLTMMQANIISFLHNNPARDTASDICELRMFFKAVVSRTVEEMISLKLLERHGDTKDRRKVHLTLTKKAEPVTDDIAVLNERFVDFLFGGFSVEDMASFDRLHRRIADNVGRALTSGVSEAER